MKITFVFIVLTICHLASFSQGNIIDSISSSWANLNYNVPESPAYFLLKTNPENILEPSSTKNLAITIAEYYVDKGMVIPKNFGLELSPTLFIKKVSLRDFKKNEFFYRTKLSFGTNSLENNHYQLAEGLRFTIFDKRDLRTNPSFISQLEKYSFDRNKIKTRVLENYFMENEDKFGSRILFGEAYNTDTVLKKKIDELVELECEKVLLSRNQLQNIKDEFTKNNWNSMVWEFGLAAMQEAQDSLFKNLRFKKAGLWTAYSGHITDKDQIMAGASFLISDSLQEWKPQFGLAMRYYRGSNEWRGFVQMEYKNFDAQNSLTSSLGLLFEITEGNWGQLTFNVCYDFKGNISYTPAIKIGISPKSKGKDKMYQ